MMKLTKFMGLIRTRYNSFANQMINSVIACSVKSATGLRWVNWVPWVIWRKPP